MTSPDDRKCSDCTFFEEREDLRGTGPANTREWWGICNRFRELQDQTLKVPDDFGCECWREARD